MNKPKLSQSVGCFGLKWLDGGKYEITREKEYLQCALDGMKKNGFDAIELSTAGPWNFEEERANYPWIKTAIQMIKRSNLETVIANGNEPQNLIRAIKGEKIGTRVISE